MASSLLHPTPALQFALLGPEHAQACYQIEQKCIVANQDLVARAEIHPKTFEQYAAFLQRSPERGVIGAFLDGELVAFGAYTIPNQLDDLRDFERVQLDPKDPFQLAALALCSHGPTAMNHLLRVDPAFKGRGIGQQIIEARIANLLRSIVNAQYAVDKVPEAGLVITNITATNLGSLNAQLSSRVSTPLLWSAGYEMDGNRDPAVYYVVHVNPEHVPIAHLRPSHTFELEQVIGTRDQAPGGLFDYLANFLNRGYVAYRSPTNRGVLCIAERPALLQAHY